MLLCVRGTGLLPLPEGWAGLAIQTFTGMAVYGALCVGYWRISGQGIRLGKRKSGEEPR